MSLFDDLSDSIFSQDSKRGFHIAGILFILLTIRAIVKLKKVGLIIKFFTEPKTYFSTVYNILYEQYFHIGNIV